MNHPSGPANPAAMQPVLARLQSLGRCSADLESQVLALGARTEAAAAKSVVWSDDTSIHRPRYLLAGWACLCRHLPDGRRQIFDLVLPGDGIGLHAPSRPSAGASVVALTRLRLVDASSLTPDDHQIDGVPLARAQADADQERAFRQIMRLGRMTALERLADLFLETHERLDAVGQVEGPRFAFPLTQETLADLAGLSVVHVNRTLQELRRRSLVTIEHGWVQLDVAGLQADLAESALRRLAG